MAIVIKKKASTIKLKGKCEECTKWSQTNLTQVWVKKNLGWCKTHVCYTPGDGSCWQFEART